MGRKVDLPDGGWAQIRDSEELSVRQRQLIRRHVFGAAQAAEKLAGMNIDPDAPQEWWRFAAQIGAEDQDALDAAQAASVVARLDSWSLDRDLPTMEDVYDLDGPTFDALAKAVAETPGDGTVDFGTTLDPDSPTAPSAG